MRTLKYSFLLLLAFFAVSVSMQAKRKLQPVYLVGYAFSPIDSTAYMTQVQHVDSAWVDTKAKTLYYRTNYTVQLQSFLETKMGGSNLVCAVFFDKKKPKMDKKLQRIHRYQKRNAIKKLDVIPADVFRFQTEKWSENE